MTRKQYEQHKRRLEAQLRTGEAGKRVAMYAGMAVMRDGVEMMYAAGGVMCTGLGVMRAARVAAPEEICHKAGDAAPWGRATWKGMFAS